MLLVANSPAFTGIYLFTDVLERGRRDDGEADEEHVGLRVAQRSQSIVVLLTGRVEQTECVRLAADHHGHRIVVEHRRDVFARKFVGRVRDEQAGFTDGTLGGAERKQDQLRVTGNRYCRRILSNRLLAGSVCLPISNRYQSPTSRLPIADHHTLDRLHPFGRACKLATIWTFGQGCAQKCRIAKESLRERVL